MNINKCYNQLYKIKKELSEDEINEALEIINENIFFINDYNFKNLNELKNKVNPDNFIKFITETDDNLIKNLEILREKYSRNCETILDEDIKDFYKSFPFLKLFVHDYKSYYHLNFFKNYYKYNNDILKDNNYLKICFNLQQKEDYNKNKIKSKIRFLLNFIEKIQFNKKELRCNVICYMFNEIFQNKKFLIKHKNFYNAVLEKVIELEDEQIFRYYFKQINIDVDYLIKQLTDIKEEIQN